ncbi:MAG: 2-C-methyl-D-erythritol 2,4-cyclodiphosphate synthase [Acidimicrobiales bacterium]
MSGPRAGSFGLRIGQGFDVHRFSSDTARRLVLGGVTIDGGQALEGHSDADVVCHSLADALLGATGLGDIGGHFPETDPAWEGASSLELLGRVVSMLDAEGARALNADCTIVCERPRLAEHTGEMARRLTSALGAPVSVKAKRAEGLGALGRAEGIACLAATIVECRTEDR